MEPRIINNFVVFPVPDGAILEQFLGVKTATVNGQDFCAVPHDLNTVRFFANQGVKIPNPIETKYHWPGRFKPYRHQIVTSEFLTLNKRAFVNSGMGTGKTKAALWALDYLMEAGEIQKTIIFAPLSTLDRVWAQEVFETLPHRRAHILHGTREKRFTLLADRTADIYITNHDATTILHDELGKRPDINHVLIDECFPTGTKISTPCGERCIDTLQLGDIIDTSWGPMPVTRVFRRQTKRMVRLSFEDGTHVDCTPGHPFATDRGWTEATETEGARCLRGSDLRPLRQAAYRFSVRNTEATGVLRSGVRQSLSGSGTYLPKVWEDLSDDKELRSAQPREVLFKAVREPVPGYGPDDGRSSLRSVRYSVSSAAFPNALPSSSMLFQGMRAEMGVGEQPQQETWATQSGCEVARAPCLEQGSLRPNRSAPAGYTGTNRSLHPEPTRERDRDDAARGDSLPISPVRIYPQPSDLTRTANTWVSDQLQSGFWARQLENRRGSGRGQSQQSESSGAGPEERSEALGVRVVRVEDLELGSPQWVFNLEVTGPHDYIAGGKVVHNCSQFRNMPTRRAKAMFSIVNRQSERSCWGMTGTPTPNAPTDCYGQIRIVKPENYKGSFKAIQNELMYQVSQFRWVPRAGSQNRVHELMQPSIRYALEDCIDLPETIWSVRECELSPEQAKAYKEMRTTAVAEIGGEQITAANAAVLLGKLLQASLFGMYRGDGTAAELDFGPRYSLVEEIIEECDEKVIVFVPFTAALAAFEERLRKKWSMEVIEGDVSSGKRNDIFRRFQTKTDPHLLLAHPKTMAHGLNLTAATTILWTSPYPSNEIFQQANARIVRPGQTKVTNIVMIQGSPAERGLYRTLKERGRLQDVLLELKRGGG